MLHTGTRARIGIGFRVHWPSRTSTVTMVTATPRCCSFPSASRTASMSRGEKLTVMMYSRIAEPPILRRMAGEAAQALVRTRIWRPPHECWVAVALRHVARLLPLVPGCVRPLVHAAHISTHLARVLRGSASCILHASMRGLVCDWFSTVGCGYGVPLIVLLVVPALIAALALRRHALRAHGLALITYGAFRHVISLLVYHMA
jgi:hypothetical protein